MAKKIQGFLNEKYKMRFFNIQIYVNIIKSSPGNIVFCTMKLFNTFYAKLYIDQDILLYLHMYLHNDLCLAETFLQILSQMKSKIVLIEISRNSH